MYGGGPIIVREALDIYSKDLSKEVSSRPHSALKKTYSTDFSKSSNIFAKKEYISPHNNQQQPRKKRNLFQSESLNGLDEDLGIPEESPQHQVGSMQIKSNIQKPSFSEKIDSFFAKQANSVS